MGRRESGCCERSENIRIKGRGERESHVVETSFASPIPCFSCVFNSVVTGTAAHVVKTSSASPIPCVPRVSHPVASELEQMIVCQPEEIMTRGAEVLENQESRRVEVWNADSTIPCPASQWMQRL